jgi:hypothetical protein
MGRAIGISTVAAVAIQPIVFWIWFLLPALFHGTGVPLSDVLEMASYELLVSLGFVVILGLPIFFTLRLTNRTSPLVLAASGFLAGAIPYALYTWPASSPYLPGTTGYFRGNWHGRHVEFSVNGVLTTYGWLSYAEAVAMFGLHGLVGALVFLAVWRRVAHRAVKV